MTFPDLSIGKWFRLFFNFWIFLYNHKKIEKKWQDSWEKNKVFKVENDFLKPKFYCLDMFPYPSGAGLHVGHPEGFTANDILARYKHAKGFNVLHPMWWDAFWLPAENYAIKTWTHPRITTDENINTFKKQIKALGFSYDWSREIDTTDTAYYKWTQWIFLKLYEKWLAYEQDLPINYCPSCKTWISNEEVLNDFTCERCHSKVEKKKIRQWVLAITKYAKRLLKDVDKLDWPESIKDMQRNWIGKSEWCEFEMKKVTKKWKLPPSINWDGLNILAKSSSNFIDDKLTKEYKNYLGDDNLTWKISVYTTRIDTVFGMTYAVIAPDHPKVFDFITSEQKKSCLEYIDKTKKKSDQDRLAENKQKTWVFTGSYLINPFNNEKISLWIADYILGNYWTWAVMAVPAHDSRDFEFAKKYGLEIKCVIQPRVKMMKWTTDDDVEKVLNNILKWEKVYTEEGYLMASGKFDWLHSEEAKKNLIQYAEKNWFWNKKINYKLRDWLFSRQRYWWEPIPLVHLEEKDLEKLERFDIKNKKNENYHSKKELVTHNGDTAKYSLTHNILENVKKVKRKNKKIIFSTTFKEIKTKRWIIIFNWKKLDKYFSMKKWREKIFRRLFWYEILCNLDNIFFESDLVWYISINCKIFRIILEKIWDKKYEIKTYYSSLKYTKFFNQAYIKKSQDWDYLWIRWEQFSKIHNWIYSKIVCDYNLPLKLPEVEKYEPSWDWNSPLANVPSFFDINLAENLKWKRETNTMPQWWWSCWYYLRFMDSKNSDKLVDEKIEKYWWQVDSYVGWAEHAVLHLLYARFWHKFLYDIWVVSTDEPFYRLRNQGLVLAHAYQKKNWGLIANDLVEEKSWKYYEISSGEELSRVVAKMSKSLKNVVNPDDIIKEYWADSLRLYEMYMADFKDTAPWDTKWIIGMRRFLDKAEKLFQTWPKISKEDDVFTIKLLHKTIKKVEEDIENYKFNTAIAQIIILVNNWLPKDKNSQKIWQSIFLKLLHPFAPHLSEELWEKIWNKESIFNSTWTEYDKNLVKDDIIKIGIQVLGKLRWEIEIWVNESKESVLQKARENENVKKWIEWKEIVKEIYVFLKDC